MRGEARGAAWGAAKMARGTARGAARIARGVAMDAAKMAGRPRTTKIRASRPTMAQPTPSLVAGSHHHEPSSRHPFASPLLTRRRCHAIISPFSHAAAWLARNPTIAPSLVAGPHHRVPSSRRPLAIVSPPPHHPLGIHLRPPHHPLATFSPSCPLQSHPFHLSLPPALPHAPSCLAGMQHPLVIPASSPRP